MTKGKFYLFIYFLFSVPIYFWLLEQCHLVNMKKSSKFNTIELKNTQSWVIETEPECLSFPLWKAAWCTQNVTNSVATRHLSQCHVLWHYICFYYWYIPITLKEKKKSGLHVLFLKHIEVSIILLSN